MKKRLLLFVSLIGCSTAFGQDGLLGSQLQYQDVVGITAVLAILYAGYTYKSLADLGNQLKTYVSAAIACGAGLAIFYSNQFNNMVPDRLRVNQFCDGLNTILPYWFAFIITGATYSKFCDIYDYYFKPEKKEEKNKPNIVFGLKNVQ